MAPARRRALHGGGRRDREVAGLGGVPSDQEAVCGGERQRRVAGKLLAGEAGQPALDDLVTPLCHVRDDACPEQVSRPDRIVRTYGVGDRPVGVTARLAPRARAIVEPTHQLGVGASELRPERVAEQPVPPIPLVRWVERPQQRGRPFEPAERERGARGVEHRIAQRTRQLFEH